MSRSHKKNSYHKNCRGKLALQAQQEWKRSCNKKLRSLDDEDIGNFSFAKKLSGDIWESPSDGKGYRNDIKGMRK